MKKRINYVVLSVSVILAASCTFAVYVQKNNTDSTQKVRILHLLLLIMPSITIQSPLK